MFSEKEKGEIQFVINSYLNKLIVDTARLFNDIRGKKGWFLFLIQDKIEVLKNIDEENLVNSGQIILNNLASIKNFDFLVFLINSMVSTDTLEFVNDLGGEISLINVDTNTNYEPIEKIYNAFSGDEKVYQGNLGDEKIYQREAVLNDTDLFEFLPQFILKGVKIKAIELNDASNLAQVYHNGFAVLHGGETVFI